MARPQKILLCIPRVGQPLGDGRILSRTGFSVFELFLFENHPLASGDSGALIDSAGGVFDRADFMHLRDTVGAWLLADEKGKVGEVLGLELDELIAFLRPGSPATDKDVN